MNSWKWRNIRVLFLLLLALLAATPGYAHPGALDSKGGHYDHSTGEYHYHHGYPAHQHTDGVCPYDFDDQTRQGSEPSTSNSFSGSANTASTTRSTSTASTSNATSDWHPSLTDLLSVAGSLAILLFWWVPFSIVSWLFKTLCAIFSKVCSFLRPNKPPSIQTGGVNMSENMSLLSLTVSYASFINDAVNGHIPAQYQPFSLFIIIGSLTAWAEMALSQTRAVSNHIIQTVAQECSDQQLLENELTNLMFLSSDSIGQKLSSTPPERYFPVYASTLMAQLKIESNIEVHTQISVLLSSFSKAFVEALSSSRDNKIS